MPYLLIDNGNTKAKLAVVDGQLNFLCDIENVEHSRLVAAAQRLGNQYDAKVGMLSSVADNTAEIVSALRGAGIDMKKLDCNCNLPFEIAYTTPQTLGADRIAAVAGAMALFGRRDMLIIDAGTAITYELVTADGVYRGGCIAPGVNMRFRALHEHTGKLPLVGADDFESWLGTSTPSAIAAGVINGINFEAQGYIEHIKNLYPDFNTVVLTGGDYIYFGLNTKSNIFVEPNLVLVGLASLIINN